MLELYSIRDDKMGIFMSPFPCRGVVDALRGIMSSLKNSDSPMFKFCDDFTLYRIGRFTEETGDLVPGVELVESLSTIFKTKEQL